MNNTSAMAAAVTEQFATMFYLMPWWKLEADPSKAREIKYLDNAIPMFLSMIIIELVCGFYRTGKSLYRTADTYESASLGSVQRLLAFYRQGFDVFTYIVVWENFRLVDLTPATPLEWFFCLCAVDLGYYWMHRHAHEYHVFWIGHSVHHSGEDFNLATALRQGITQIWFAWIWKLPCALFFSPVSFFAHTQLNTLYQFWIHTTLIGHLGPLELFLNTPSHHRMHHRPPGNRNYAGVLIIWDRMFGTFEVEDEQKDYYGLAKAHTSFDPIAANWEHPRRMLNNVGGGKPRNLWFYLSLLTKRRVKHKSVFKPWVLFQGIDSPKADLWKLPDKPRREKLKVDPNQSTSVTLYTAWLYVSALAFGVFTMIRLFPDKEIGVEKINFALFATIFSFVCVGRISDSFTTGFYFQAVRIIALNSILASGHGANLVAYEALHAFSVGVKVDAVLWAMACIGQFSGATNTKREVNSQVASAKKSN